MRRNGRPGKTKNRFNGKLTSRHKKALHLVASGASEAEAARKTGFSPAWLCAIITTSKEAEEYLKESRDRIVAKHRMVVEASVNESLRAIFAKELGLTEEEKAALPITREAALQLGYNATVARMAGMTEPEAASIPPPISVRVNVIAMLKDEGVAKHVLRAANEAAAKGLLVQPRAE